jgi:GT2 family glycosyltransferase
VVLLSVSDYVVIASAGRASLLAENLPYLANSLPEGVPIVLCVPSLQDAPPVLPRQVTVILGPRGLTAQRNCAMNALPPDTGLVIFFDDDCLPGEGYVDRAREIFRDRPDVVGLTGTLLRDGVITGEVPYEEAVDLLAHATASEGAGPVDVLYGCNFAVRFAAARLEYFDERLPLYGWLEDEDFSRRLGRRGLLLRASDCLCVHQGFRTGGRSSHRRLGYSQIINPVYLHRKGSVTLLRSIYLATRPVAANVLGLLGHRRQARLALVRGNLLAVADLARLRLRPERAAEL